MFSKHKFQNLKKKKRKGCDFILSQGHFYLPLDFAGFLRRELVFIFMAMRCTVTSSTLCYVEVIVFSWTEDKKEIRTEERLYMYGRISLFQEAKIMTFKICYWRNEVN